MKIGRLRVRVTDIATRGLPEAYRRAEQRDRDDQAAPAAVLQRCGWRFRDVAGSGKRYVNPRFPYNDVVVTEQTWMHFAGDEDGERVQVAHGLAHTLEQYLSHVGGDVQPPSHCSPFVPSLPTARNAGERQGPLRAPQGFRARGSPTTVVAPFGVFQRE